MYFFNFVTILIEVLEFERLLIFIFYRRQNFSWMIFPFIQYILSTFKINILVVKCYNYTDYASIFLYVCMCVYLNLRGIYINNYGQFLVVLGNYVVWGIEWGSTTYKAVALPLYSILSYAFLIFIVLTYNELVSIIFFFPHFSSRYSLFIIFIYEIRSMHDF